MCGASDQSKDTFAQQEAFFKELRSEYKTRFGEDEALLSKLTASFEPILAKGINQEGFSQAELDNLNSQAVTGTGQNYAKAAAALGAQQGAEGGGTAYIPSGAKHQQQAQLAESAAENESGLESTIKAADYATGRENYLAAAQGLEGVSGLYNPTALAGVTNNAGEAQAQTANEITQANNSWMNLVGGALGAAGNAVKFTPCWVAAAVFNGWEDPRTLRVRAYLFGDFRKSWAGRILTDLYLKYGERASRSKAAVFLLAPIFHYLNYAANRSTCSRDC